jgi:hypothetical protein
MTLELTDIPEWQLRLDPVVQAQLDRIEAMLVRLTGGTPVTDPSICGAEIMPATNVHSATLCNQPPHGDEAAHMWTKEFTDAATHQAGA